MDRTEAIQILKNAGRAAEVVQVMEGKHRDAENAYAAIEKDPDLNDDAKARYVAGHYMSVMTGIDRELSNLASSVRVVDHDDASTIFGVKGLDGDPASLAISRRDASDRVARCESREEVRKLLASATRSGDEVLARACVEDAVRARDSKTANQYLETRPEHDAGLQRLWDAGERRGGDMRIAMAHAGLRPSRLGGMDSYRIEALAQGVSA